ncbi:MAG: hypothetical protein ACRD1G_08440 [Acidimicrobiales bacterium]
MALLLAPGTLEPALGCALPGVVLRAATVLIGAEGGSPAPGDGRTGRTDLDPGGAFLPSTVALLGLHRSD